MQSWYAWDISSGLIAQRMVAIVCIVVVGLDQLVTSQLIASHCRPLIGWA